MKIVDAIADRLLTVVVPHASAAAVTCWVASCCDYNMKYYCCNYNPEVRCRCEIHTSDCKG